MWKTARIRASATALTGKPPPPAGGHTFLSEPLSVHTFDEEAFRDRSGTVVVTPGMVVLAAILLAAGGVALLWHHLGTHMTAFAAALVIGIVMILLLVSMAAVYIDRWCRITLWRATRVEVWPDCIIRRTNGRPPLAIRRDEIASVHRNWTGVKIRKAGDPFNPMFVPEYLVGFDDFWEHVRQWQVSGAFREKSVWREPSYLIGVLGSNAGLWICLLTENPWFATAAAAMAIAASSLVALFIWQGRHRDKWSRRLVWAYPALMLVAVGLIVADAWLPEFGTRLFRVIRPLLP
ncbi:MAG: hypothetical protein JXL80_00085 [Planctomycetes bacterium]|nr:hypothetical protein [Planctomycetota bacterium]